MTILQYNFALSKQLEVGRTKVAPDHMSTPWQNCHNPFQPVDLSILFICISPFVILGGSSEYFHFSCTWVRYPVWQHTFVSPSAFSRRAVVSYWRKYVHEVLVNHLGGLSLPRKSVIRLTDRPDMTLDVYRGRKTTMQQQHFSCILLGNSCKQTV